MWTCCTNILLLLWQESWHILQSEMIKFNVGEWNNSKIMAHFMAEVVALLPGLVCFWGILSSFVIIEKKIQGLFYQHSDWILWGLLKTILIENVWRWVFFIWSANSLWIEKFVTENCHYLQWSEYNLVDFLKIILLKTKRKWNTIGFFSR